jgi:hypothetical protein
LRAFQQCVALPCPHWGQVESWLLVVGSQTDNLTPDLSFYHNLCYRCSNGSCKAIFDIYTSITFQWYERFKARCFDLCNWTLKFQKSWRTPKSPFRECECHPHTPPKMGLQHVDPIDSIMMYWKYYKGLKDNYFIVIFIFFACFLYFLFLTLLKWHIVRIIGLSLNDRPYSFLFLFA